MSGNPLLQVQGLTKRFGGLVAVKDIAFGIGPGEILGLIGPNGSGKSTVMKLIMGVERPNAGRVMLDGLDMAGWPTHRIARAGVGIVFQHSRPLNRQTVLENIKLALLPELAAETGRRPACGAPRAARSPCKWDWRRSSTAARRLCPSPICAAWKWRRPWRAIRRWSSSMSPSPA